MNGSQLLILTEGLLGGNTIDEDIFYSLINMAKNSREVSRDWCNLRAEDTSKTFTASDDYTSTKALPARFLRVYRIRDQYGTIGGVYIITSNGSKVELDPIPFARRYDYKDTEGYYYIDYANSTIGRTGTTSGTLHLHYLQGTVDIDSDTSWSFPDFASPLLAFDVALINRGQIDWDTVNQSQIPFNEKTIRQIESDLNMWDARNQQAELGV